jgi:hypothetical protein
MKFSAFLLFYIFLSLTTLSLSAQSSTTEVVAEKSIVVSKKLGVSKQSGETTCIRVSQNSESLQQGQEVVITVKGCKNLKMHKVLVSGSEVEINDKGIAKLSRRAGMIGTHTIPVDIVFIGKDPNHKTESYTVTYEVRKSLSQ